jgi:hypothetical protein
MILVGEEYILNVNNSRKEFADRKRLGDQKHMFKN